MPDVRYRWAEFSVDRKRRYSLTRSWANGELRPVNFIGLNPSMADETHDDMTIRKCIGFAKRWGYNAVVMTNLSPHVATDPWDLPLWNGIDPRNREEQQLAISAAAIVVAAWGSVNRHIARNIALPELIHQVRLLVADRPLYCIGRTKDGSPLHPSRVAYTDAPLIWRDGGAAAGDRTDEHRM